MKVPHLPKFATTVAAMLAVCCFPQLPVCSETTLATCEAAGGGKLRYTWGDAFDSETCLGPNGLKYPTKAIDTIVHSYTRSLRKGRSMKDPYDVREQLLRSWAETNGETSRHARASQGSCSGSSTKRLCKTTYNTTAPRYGVSLTSGEPVTIVQKFPDLLQQVIFEVCVSDECDVIRGKCTQTYLPYLFLVVPLGPVTLTGQDYVMVESGCVCRSHNSNGDNT